MRKICRRCGNFGIMMETAACSDCYYAEAKLRRDGMPAVRDEQITERVRIYRLIHEPGFKPDLARKRGE